MNLADPIEEAIALVPSRVALVVDEDEVTFAALGVAIDNASSALVSAGVVRGDRVPLVASSGLLATATVLACARIGAAAAPMSARATANEIGIMARTAGCGDVAVAEHEIEQLRGELNAILAFVEQLSEVDVEGVEPMTSVIPMEMKKRPDVVTDGGIADAILKNAPAAEEHFFVVPKVVE